MGQASLAVMFVDFNGYSLPALRGKLFAEKQVYASSEFDIQKLIMTGRQPDVLRHKSCNKPEEDTLVLASGPSCPPRSLL